MAEDSSDKMRSQYVRSEGNSESQLSDTSLS